MTTQRSILTSPCFRGTQAFALLLGSIAASVGAGCASQEDRGSGGTKRQQTETDGGEAGPLPPLEGEVVRAVCPQDVPSFTEGLHPAIDVDSITHFVARNSHLCTAPDYSIVSEMGTPCASAEDEAACLAEVERLRAGSADWGKYEDFFSASWGLLVVTGSEDNVAKLGGPVQELTSYRCGTWTRGETPQQGEPADVEEGTGDAGVARDLPPPVQSANATTVADRATLLKLLGKIDTPNEAALVMWAHDIDPPCDLTKNGDEYATRVVYQLSDCPITYQQFEIRVSSDGQFVSIPVGEEWDNGACVGRRPDGLCAGGSTDADGSAEGRWLAQVARLEAAAVVAFAQLSKQLERLGAPQELVVRARGAALDEIRHARDVRRLAMARGCSVPPTIVSNQPRRTLLSIAVENAVEGCVRECWGALIAHYQAKHARDASVRRVWKTIAEEESGHAVLSMDIARWLHEQLDPSERETVARARSRAIADLREEIYRGPHSSPTLGLPDTESSLRLFGDLERHVFTPWAA